MAELKYTAITSLDGFIEDKEGRFDWAEPDAEVHAFINDLERPIGTHLYGRRTYETMAVWQTIGDEPGLSAAEADFAEMWRARGQGRVFPHARRGSTPRTRLERDFDPEAVRRMKEAADHDISVSGPGLAQHAFRAGLVDEVDLFVFSYRCRRRQAGPPPGRPGRPRAWSTSVGSGTAWSTCVTAPGEVHCTLGATDLPAAGGETCDVG